MGSDLNPCANVIRVILVIINILFVILGCILIGVGSWGIAVDSDFSFVTGSGIASGATIIIVAGCLTVVICVLGIVGAIFKWRPLLVIYASILVAIVCLEIVAGILAFFFRGTVVGGLAEGSLNAIRLYPTSVDSANSTQRDAMTAVDAIQNTLSCCGYNNATDWPRENPLYLAENNGDIPQEGGCITCTDGENCMQFTGTYSFTLNGRTITDNYDFNASGIGCFERLEQRIEDNLVLIGSVAGAVGVVFGILEITGIVLAYVLFCCICSARKQTVV